MIASGSPALLGDQLHVTGLVTLVCGVLLVAAVIVVVVQMLRERR